LLRACVSAFAFCGINSNSVTLVSVTSVTVTPTPTGFALMIPSLNADRGGAGIPLPVPEPARRPLIQLTRLNGNPIALNSDLIKFVENAPDTVITLINGEKIIVRESSDEVVHRIVDFRRCVIAGLPSCGADINSAALHPQENSTSRGGEAFRRG